MQLLVWRLWGEWRSESLRLTPKMIIRLGVKVLPRDESIAGKNCSSEIATVRSLKRAWSSSLTTMRNWIGLVANNRTTRTTTSITRHWHCWLVLAPATTRRRPRVLVHRQRPPKSSICPRVPGRSAASVMNLRSVERERSLLLQRIRDDRRLQFADSPYFNYI